MTTRWLIALGFVFISFSVPAQAANVSTRTVDVGNQSVFPMRWHQTLVRKGTHRQMSFAMGKPVVSNKHNLVAEEPVRAISLAFHHAAVTSFGPKSSRPNLSLSKRLQRWKPAKKWLFCRAAMAFLRCLNGTWEVIWSVELGAESRNQLFCPKAFLLLQPNQNWFYWG